MRKKVIKEIKRMKEKRVQENNIIENNLNADKEKELIDLIVESKKESSEQEKSELKIKKLIKFKINKKKP